MTKLKGAQNNTAVMIEMDETEIRGMECMEW